jgi:ADP-ribose pyrophosphatase
MRAAFSTPWFSIEGVPWGAGKEPYYRLTCDDSVEVLALTPAREIVLLRQFRPALGMTLLELPAGHVDAGERPGRAVRRELLEETGHRCRALTRLGSFKISPSRINNDLHLFFAADARPAPKAGRREEGIEVVLLPLEEFAGLVRRGRYLEVAGIAAYQLALARGLLGAGLGGGGRR